MVNNKYILNLTLIFQLIDKGAIFPIAPLSYIITF